MFSLLSLDNGTSTVKNSYPDVLFLENPDFGLADDQDLVQALEEFGNFLLSVSMYACQSACISIYVPA